MIVSTDPASSTCGRRIPNQAATGVSKSRSVPILDLSRRRAVVVVQDSAEASAGIDRSAGMRGNGQRDDRSGSESLMVAFEMIVFGVLA